jgi:hypothetical protein
MFALLVLLTVVLQSTEIGETGVSMKVSTHASPLILEKDVQLTTADRMIGCWSPIGAVIEQHKASKSPVRWSNVRIYGCPEDLTEPFLTNMGFCAWDVAGWSFEDCTVDMLLGQGHRFMTLGGVTWTRCHFDLVDGEAIDVGFAWPTGHNSSETFIKDPRFWHRIMREGRTEWQKIQGSLFTYCGKERWAVDFRDATGPRGERMNPVGIANTEFRAPHAGGAIAIRSRTTAILTSNKINYLNADRPVVFIVGCTDERQGTIDVGLRYNEVNSNKEVLIVLLRREDTVDVYRNRGNARLRVEWRGETLHEGPISQDWRWN